MLDINSQNRQNQIRTLLFELMQSLELTATNLETKLEAVQSFALNNYQKADFDSIDGKSQKIIQQLKPLMTDSFYLLDKQLGKLFLQNNQIGECYLNQIKDWLNKDFTNAEKLYRREFATKLTQAEFQKIQADFILNLISNQQQNVKNALSFNNDALAKLADFNTSLVVQNSNSGTDFLASKYLLLTQHTNIKPNKILYLCVLPVNQLKRQADFYASSKNLLKANLLRQDFFYKFKISMQEFCNLPSFIYKTTSAVALNGKICLGVLEKLVADFLFVNAISFEHYSAIAKPKNYPNFYIAQSQTKIFITAQHSLQIQMSNKENINLDFENIQNKTSAYIILEQALTNLKFSPLTPEQLEKQLINLYEKIFIHQGTEILQLWLQQNFSIEQLEQLIKANFKKVHASSSLIYLFLQVYKQILCSATAKKLLAFNKNEFLLLDTAENLTSQELKNLEKFKGKIYLNSAMGAQNINVPNLYLSPKKPPSLLCLDLFSFSAQTTSQYADNFFMAKFYFAVKYLLNVKPNFDKQKFAICLASCWQIDYCRNWLNKHADKNILAKLEFFCNFDAKLKDFTQNPQHQIIILDLAFIARLNQIHINLLDEVFPNINTEILNAKADFYAQLLSLNLTRTIIFASTAKSAFYKKALGV